MSDSSHARQSPLLSDRNYNVLKRTVTLILPALGTLYFALAQIWHLGKGEEVVGTLAALNTFLGVVLGISSRSYNNSDAKYAGEIQVDDSGEKKIVTFVMNDDPHDLEKMTEATFKISDTGSNPIVKL